LFIISNQPAKFSEIASDIRSVRDLVAFAALCKLLINGFKLSVAFLIFGLAYKKESLNPSNPRFNLFN